MLVFRGERLKDNGYVEEQREVHKEELSWMRAYHVRELAQIRIKEEELIIDKNGEMEKYKIYTKPISELSNKEKERIILQYHSIQKTFGIEIPKGKMYTDEEVESIREVLKPENPLDHVRWEMSYHSEKLKEAEEAFKNNITIALNRNAISRANVDAIINAIKAGKSKGKNVRVCIDNASLRKNSEGVDYVFDKKEMNLLLELDNFLKDNGYPGLSITEFKEAEDLEDFKKMWTLNQVVEANNKVDKFVEYIKENELSPFEAMLYIHKVATNFVYNGDGIIMQEGRVLPSILNTDKIVCSGYSTLVKAIVDKLDMPGLKCELKGCYIIIDGMPHGHCHNLVTIDDPKYSVKGVYVEDACWDSKEKGKDNVRGLAHCLYSVNDLMNFNGNRRYYSLDREDRLSNLIIDPKELNEHLKMAKANWVSKLLWNISRKSKYQHTIPEIVKTYGEDSNPIPMDTYKRALSVVYATRHDDLSLVEEKVNADIEKSKEKAVKTFNANSTNAFSSALTSKERKQIAKNPKGPNTRM